MDQDALRAFWAAVTVPAAASARDAVGELTP
jgi:hypothetical protein